MSRRLTAGLTALLAGGVLMLSACGPDESGDGPRASSTPAATSTSSTGTTAAAALAQGGLTLPSGATDVTVEQRDKPPYRAFSQVHFSLPLDDAKAWCDTGGLGGALPAVVVPAAQQEFLGVTSAPDGSIICMSSWPQDVSWQRVVLAEPGSGGSPGRVTVAVYRMPTH